MKPGIALIIIGVVLFGVLLGVSMLFDRSGWPTTQGTITKTNVEQKYQGRTGDTFSMSVEYVFEVDGKQYRGDRVAIMKYTSPNKASLMKSMPYHKGKPVTVYYNADAPEECLLVPGLNLGPHLYMWPCVFAIGGLILMVKALFASKPEA